MQTESLESRHLLAGVTVVFSTDKGGILRITGTSGDDNVQVSLKGRTQFTVSDGTQTLTYDRTAVKRLTFLGGDGNDAISLGRVPLISYMNGEGGNDSLSASSGELNDSLYGTSGDDYLYGGPGRDLLNGGIDNDLMFGGAGNDTLYALSLSNADDTLSGGDGRGDVALFDAYTAGVKVRVGVANPSALSVHDVVLGDVEIVVGSSGADRITNESGHPMQLVGGAGNDTITGGSANDTLYGGAGKDLLTGGGGDDRFKAAGDASDGPDTLVGGSGTGDWAYYDDTDVINTIEGRITFSQGPEQEPLYTGPDNSDVIFEF